jgi:hypothetical protein
MLFTALGYRVTQWTTPRAVLVGWWLTLATFSLVALLQVRRAYSLIINSEHSAAANDIVTYQLKRLKSNMKGAAIVLSLAALSGGYYVFVARPSLQLSYALAAASVLVHARGLIAHSNTAKGLRRALLQMLEEPTMSDETAEPAHPPDGRAAPASAS